MRMLIVVYLWFLVLAGNAWAAPEAMITLKLLDDEGQEVSGMPVRVGFFEGKQNRGITDTNGMFTAGGHAISGQATFSVMEDGWYYSHGVFTFPKAGQPWSNAVSGDKWQPWNPVVTMVVKRIVNPIAMYAKHVKTMIPTTNVAFGYDLVFGDWVRPAGNGVVSDLVFRIDGHWEDYRNNDSVLRLNFSQPKDGLVPVDYEVLYGNPSGSALFMPRYAYEAGYVSSGRWRKASMQAQTDDDRDGVVSDTRQGRGYLVRVRSTTNRTGVVTNAYYGKIPDDFVFGAAGTNGGLLSFTYYLNPTPNDRNLEFDPKQNLFKDLKPMEQVREP